MMRITGGYLRGRKLKAPPAHTTRPTQSNIKEAVFNVCQDQIQDANFLDLFAGSGAMGIEALSRGASSATFIDRSPLAINCIQKNCHDLDLENKVRIIKKDLLQALKTLSQSFDIIYIDPPYDQKNPLALPSKILELLFARSLVANNGSIFLEIPYQKKEESISLPFVQIIRRKRYGSSELLLLQFTSLV